MVNAEPGTVPFAVTFDAAGHLVIADAGTDALVHLHAQPQRDGGPHRLCSGTGQAATCWVAPAPGYLYASNAGSASVSGYQRERQSASSPCSATTATDPGTVDGSASADGQFLYVQTGGNGIVDEFHVNGNGSLTEIGSVTVAGAVGGEGIVAF